MKQVNLTIQVDLRLVSANHMHNPLEASKGKDGIHCYLEIDDALIHIFMCTLALLNDLPIYLCIWHC